MTQGDEQVTNSDDGRTRAYVTKPAISVRLAARTDVGQIREHNEDNLLVSDISRKLRDPAAIGSVFTLDRNGALFAVCDGMGGAAAGEVASQMAVDILFERMVDSLDESKHLTRDELARRLVRSVEVAGVRIFQEARADRTRRGMGTTVTAAALLDHHLFLAQVGDSRGYILRDGRLAQVTRDQSLVNQLIEAGQLTEEEAETFEHNNIILQALGTADTVQVDLTYVQVRPGDVLMLCSDGLSGMLRGEEIRQTLASSDDPDVIARSLIDKANAAGGHDNITVVIAHFSGSALEGDSDSTDSPEKAVLKYRKYALPEETSSEVESKQFGTGRIQKTVPPPNLFPQGQGAETTGSGHAGGVDLAPKGPSSFGPGPRSNPSGFPPEDDPRVVVPGTHVPAWVIVILILLVIGILAGGAAIFLH